MSNDKKQSFQTLVQTGRDFLAYSDDVATPKKLEPGAYKFEYNPMQNTRKFIQFVPKSDEILDVPSLEYTRILAEMQYFLSPECRTKFKEAGFLYKRSALLHGLPGTGKSILVSRIMGEVIRSGGIVLFIENPRLLPLAYEVIDDLQPETVVLTVLEEIDGIIAMHGDQSLLSILDGEIQKENVMYLATTNYLNKIPARILRPGRISSVIEVNYPDKAGRAFYFDKKLKNLFPAKELARWVELTNGLSIDELKEVVQSVYIFNNQVEEVIKRIRSVKANGGTAQDYEKNEDDEDWEDELLGNHLRVKGSKY